MGQSTRHSAGTYEGTEQLTESEYHKLLASGRRRTTLDVLSTSAAPVELTDLATSVTAREAGGDGTNEKAVERVAIGLHHAHLPMMNALGVIDYDPDASRVESCP